MRRDFSELVDGRTLGIEDPAFWFFYVYKITNTLNNKVYIGITCSEPMVRYNKHLSSSIKGSKYHLHNAIRLYGEHNFTFEVIDNAFGNCEASDLEREYIRYYSSNDKDVGYNLTEGGEGVWGYKWSDEQRAKHSAMFSANPSWAGKRHEAETKVKISTAQLSERNHMAIKIVYNGVEYATKKECCQALEIGFSTLNRLIREGKAFEFGRCEKHEKSSKTKSVMLKGTLTGAANPSAKSVLHNGVVYGCVKDLIKHLSISQATYAAWRKSGKL